MIVNFVAACTCVEEEILSNAPELGQPSQTPPWDASEGIYKHFKKQKRMTESV
jgi:hypothetical protein